MRLSLLCLGNHDFDDGVSGLMPFIKNLTCPVLAANLNLTKVPELQSESNLLSSVVLNINGTKIGIIGYLTPETKIIANKNDVEYIEEVIAVENEAAKLKAVGVNILIALGHSGYLKDIEIAKKVQNIDLVIGGHTHTFLWNSTIPDVEQSEGPYPTMVKQDSGKVVPVVQAYAFTKYLGKINLIFDTNGNLIHIDGKPILLDNSIQQDPDVLEIVNAYSKNIQQFTERVIGRTLVHFDGLSCRLKECNVGNLVTDAMITKYASKYKISNLSRAPIGVINSGSIRVSLAHMKLPANITRGDLTQVLPFDGSLVRMSLNGSYLTEIFENSVSKYNTLGTNGYLLQVSGIKVVYDFEQPPGKRVKNIYIRSEKSSELVYSELNITKTYEILVPAFMAIGGDGYTILSGLPSTYLDFNTVEAVVDYLTRYSPVNPRVEGRIIMNNLEKLITI